VNRETERDSDSSGKSFFPVFFVFSLLLFEVGAAVPLIICKQFGFSGQIQFLNLFPQIQFLILR
jgi:hypothetical protein